MKKIGVWTSLLLLIVLTSSVYAADTTYTYTIVPDSVTILGVEIPGDIPVIGSGFHTAASSRETLLAIRDGAEKDAAKEGSATYRGSPNTPFTFIPSTKFASSEIVATLDRFLDGATETNPATIAQDARIMAALQNGANLRTNTFSNFILTVTTTDDKGKTTTQTAQFTKEGDSDNHYLNVPNIADLRQVTGLGEELSSVSPAMQEALRRNREALDNLGSENGGAQPGPLTVTLASC